MPRQNPIPPEIREAMEQKPAEERERLEQVWNLLGYLEEDDLDVQTAGIPDTEEALADLEASLEERPAQTRKPAADRAPSRSRAAQNQVLQQRMQWFTATGAICLALFAAMIWFWRVPVAVVAPLGEQVTVTLPDESTVILNSGSRLEYPRRFESWPLIASNKRRVQLQGEAIFEVTEMPKTFVVETFNAQVRVEGTRFNVWARGHDYDPQTRVTLANGIVVVTPNDVDDQITRLTEPGATVRIISHNDAAPESIYESIPVEQAFAWQSNGFSAKVFTVASIVAEIERRFRVEIELDEGIDKAHTLTFFIKEKPTAEALIENICLSTGCQYRQTSDGFAIFPVD